MTLAAGASSDGLVSLSQTGIFAITSLSSRAEFFLDFGINITAVQQNAEKLKIPTPNLIVCPLSQRSCQTEPTLHNGVTHSLRLF